MISISHASPETYWIKKAWNQINAYSAMKVMRSFPGGLQTYKDKNNLVRTHIELNRRMLNNYNQHFLKTLKRKQW